LRSDPASRLCRRLIARGDSVFSRQTKSIPCRCLRPTVNRSGPCSGAIGVASLPPAAAAVPTAMTTGASKNPLVFLLILPPIPANRRSQIANRKSSQVANRKSEMDEPIIDLQSDHYFMGEALRQAARAYAAEEVPVG